MKKVFSPLMIDLMILDFGCSGYFGSGSGHKNPPPLKSLSNIEADGQHLVISSGKNSQINPDTKFFQKRIKIFPMKKRILMKEKMN